MEPEGVAASNTAEHALDEHLQLKLDRQLAVWRDKLLAMDRRQRLLYFKHLKTGSLEFDHSDPLQTLASLNTASIPIRPVPEHPSIPRSNLALYVKDKSEETLRTSLRRIDHAANQAYTDRAVWTLHLAVLTLHWVDSADTGEQIDSPLILVPVQVEKAGADSPYVLSRTEEDIIVNPVLSSKLQQDYQLALPPIDPDDMSMETFGSEVTDAISSRVGWHIDQRMVLSNFTFQKEAMYQDLLANHAEIAEHDIVRLLALGPDAPAGEDYAFEPMPLEDLDERHAPENLFSILDADSSQRRCILSAASGKSFVMDGPPGTGKSQTIANMIAELMATGKSVLFVSEKAAALDVVRDRLSAAHLRHFLFELHSHSATRKEVAAELARTLNKRIKAQDHFSDEDRVKLRRDRRALTDFADAMNERDANLGRSVFSVVGRMLDIDVGIGQGVSSGDRWRSLSAAELDQIKTQGRALGGSWRAVTDGYKFVWRDLVRSDLGGADARELGRLAASTHRCAEHLRGRIALIDDELGLTNDLGPTWDTSAASIDRRRRLLGLLASKPNGVPAWYDARDLAAKEERASNAREEVALLEGRAASVEDSAGLRWRSIDVGLGDELSAALEFGKVESTHRAPELRFTHQVLEELRPIVDDVVADAEELGQLLGVPTGRLTIERASDLAQLAQLASSADRPDSAWLNSAHLSRVSESLASIEAVVDHVARRQESLQEMFTPAVLELDLPALVVRFREVHKGFRRWSSAARQDKRAIRAVTVSGRCNKHTIKHLDEAASWQQAVAEMEQTARLRGEDLGRRYQGQSTEFDSIRTALENARSALALATVDADIPTLAAQVTDGAAPSPRLIPIANRLSENLSEYQRRRNSLPPTQTTTYSDRACISDIRNRMTSTAEATTRAAKVVDDVSATVGRQLSAGEAATIIADIARYFALEAHLEDRRGFDTETFGAPLGMDTDFDVLFEGIRHAQEVQNLFGGPVEPRVSFSLANSSLPESTLTEVSSPWVKSRDQLLSNFADARRAELAEDLNGELDDVIEQLDEMSQNAVGDIEDWCTAQQALEYLEPLGFEFIVDALRSLPRTLEDVANAVEYGALEAWVDAKTQYDSRLRDYRATRRDELAREFRELDLALTRNTHARVIAECNRRLPLSLTSRAAQVIKREGEKKTRHKAVRVLLEETAGLVQQLKPCFMMSPLSVSQYLPKSLVFDVVIFDEASQVLPSDAINCVYRARQLIVAGDQKQLPPTDFFSATVEDSDDDELDARDFDSVLDLAKGAGALTSLPLNWHYRSRHEDLITYSNYRFYAGELMTFPGAVFDAPDLGVSLQRVNGVYNRGTSRDNPVEAARVVERVAWFKRHFPDDSIAVVTFSIAQQDRILQTIEASTEEYPELTGVLTEHDRLDGFFVKSLENVQGDERDIIIFSLGYGPDENGKFTSSFGPLNKEGGWRRLNVAITRARKRIEIVSSFSAAEMPASSNPSVRHLQGYLDFVERGRPALAIDVEADGGDAESVFEEQVLSTVRALGYDVVPQVGVAGYRIDIGVRHPERPGEYLLGIECDGAAYHSAQTARDRDRLREQVLVGLGWRIHRIWGLSWWRDRATQTDRLRQAIEAALAAPTTQSSAGSSVTGPADVSFEEAPTRVERDWITEYVRYETVPARTRDPQTPEGVADMRDFFAQVIVAEAPVHKDLLDDRFRQAWGVGRIGKRIRDAVDKALDRAHSSGPDRGGFYRLSTERTSVRGPSADTTTRKVHQVPPEEVRLAAENVVAESIVIDEETLVKQIAGVFGWLRLSSETKTAIREVVEDMRADGSLLRDAAGDYTVGDDATG